MVLYDIISLEINSFTNFERQIGGAAYLMPLARIVINSVRVAGSVQYF